MRFNNKMGKQFIINLIIYNYHQPYTIALNILYYFILQKQRT